MRRPLLALAAILLLLTGCAGENNNGEGVASAGDGKASATTGTQSEGDLAAQTAKFAQCMRDNGIDMPDPQVDGEGRVSFGMPKGDAEPVDREKMQAAHEKCKQHLPNGGEPPKLSDEDLEKMRKFSQCMRENGYPDFPDPQPEGGIRIEGDQNGDMDPESQKWKDAHAKCEQYMPTRPGDGGQKQTGGGS
ncbi:hypothetical protein [Virgisporangium ochraceum]|uniref:hypothetical protein n=1 Tax=Virgisporangium ochraceum TaxID=65505 RepID=UPI001943EC93|nr:hypothetical protein [Virgisporangium ochraceum]